MHPRFGVGDRFANADGSSRQAELGRCHCGEPISFEREPGNPRDSFAVALYLCRGVQIGYLGRDHAKWLAPLIDNGQPVVASIVRIAPKGRPFSPLALTMKVHVDGTR